MSNSIQNNPAGNINYPSSTDLGTVGANTTANNAGIRQMSDAEAAQYADLASLIGKDRNSDLAPPKAGSTITMSEKAAQQLNDASNMASADLMDFMALFQQLAQQMRNAQREVRQAEMQAQVSTLMNAAEQMKEAAAQRFTAAVVEGAMQIAGGAMQIGMSAGSMASTIKGAQMQKTADNFTAKAENLKMQGNSADAPKVLGNQMSAAHWQEKASVASGRGMALDGYGRGLSQSVSGLGGIVSASFKYEADMADAKRAELEAVAKTHENASQQANDMMQQMQDIIRDIREKLQSISQATIEANRGIARNI